MSGIKVQQYIDPEDRLWKFVEGVVSAEGFLLYDIAKPRSGFLRIFIEREKDTDSEKGSGVSADDCITVCRRLMDGFAVEGTDLGTGAEPDLEVSSPGLDRVMRLNDHFSSGIGSNVKIWLEDKAVSGVLEDFRSDTLYVKESEDTEVYRIPFAEVRKAQRVF
jgi:ribosome maturation factor RimP